MSQSWHSQGASLPIELAIDAVELTAPCRSCQRLDREVQITARVDAGRSEGAVTARCSHGHIEIIRWKRIDSA